MRLLFAFLFLFSLGCPTASIRAAEAGKPEMCMICGHACCCPEICAAEKAELRKKVLESRISCSTAATDCQLERMPASNMGAMKTEVAAPNPLFAEVGKSVATSQRDPQFRFDSPFCRSFSTPFEIPTPPPRHFLA